MADERSMTGHWRALAAGVAALMALAVVAPRFLPEPDLRENRVYAELPALPRSYGEAEAARKQLDAYVADHFPARSRLIAGLNFLRLKLGISGSARVIVGRDGWLFYNDGSAMGAARGDPPLAEADARAWLTGLAGRTEALKARGVPYLVIVAPQKETIYPQYAPAWYRGPSDTRAALRLAVLARQTGAGEVLHLYPPVADAARSGIHAYSAHDTHWTGAGAYAGYVATMRRLQRLGVTREAPRPMYDFAPTNDPPARDLAQMLGVGALVRLDYARLADNAADQKRVVTYLTDNQTWTGARVVETGQAGKPIALITVDSFSNALLPFLYDHFSRVVIAHNQDGTWREDLIARFKPDVVMLEVVESGARVSLDPAPPPSAATAARLALADMNAPPAPPSVRLPPGGLRPADRASLALLAGAYPAMGCNPERFVFDRPAGRRMLQAEGWISNNGPRPGTADAVVRLQGAGGDFLAPVSVDQDRPDVAAFLKQPAARISGYKAEIGAEALAPGDYKLLVYRRMARRWIYCSPEAALTVR